MDFAANSELLLDVKDKIDKAKGDIERLKGEIFSGIDGLGGEGSWTGQSFETFKTKCHTYESSIEMLIQVLNAYSQELNQASEKAGELVTKVAGALNEA